MTIDPRAKDFDTAELLAAVNDANARLIATAEGFDDRAVREPSLLAGWSRAHVLTHTARNADGLVNLLEWAASGNRVEMYASPQARADGIEAGAARSAAEIAADLRASGERFALATARLAPEHWRVEVERRTGGRYPADRIPWWRLEELLIHHVDLDAGYRPAHWPAAFTGPELEMVAERLSDPVLTPEAPAFRLYTEDTARNLGVRCDPTDRGAPLVRGPEAALLTWLIGRGAGDGLEVEPFDALPTLPAWS